MTIDFSDKSIEQARIDFISKETGDGKRGPFYNKTQDWVFNDNDEKLFINAVWQAYLDTNRTLPGIQAAEKDKGAFANLASEIQKFFKEGCKNFNFTHEKWCEGFISDIKEYNCYDIRYGHAQKVVNMAFKYLYCCMGIDKAKFEKCHMPLDQFTLAWYFRETGVLYQGWSWLNKTKYYEIVKRIEQILKTDILGKELVIWKEYKKSIVELKYLYVKDIKA